MTEEQYKYIEKLVNNGKISSIKKYSNESMSNYVIKTKPNKEKVINKYRAEIPNSDREIIEKMDELIIQHNLYEKEIKITNLKMAVTTAVIATILFSGFSIANKNAKNFTSAAKEANDRIEQMEEEFGREFNQDVREQVFNEILDERQQNIQNIDNEIERLKQKKEKLVNSYYETSNENAKSK